MSDGSFLECEDAGVSALHHNISTKGKNSYYYAHADRDVEGKHTEKWDGRASPRLLAKTVRQTTGPLVKAITTYAWADEDDKVTLYVPFDGADALPEENFSFEWTPKSICLKISMPESNEDQILSVNLHDEIEKARTRRRSNKVVITLVKKTPVKWYELKAKAKA